MWLCKEHEHYESLIILRHNRKKANVFLAECYAKTGPFEFGPIKEEDTRKSGNIRVCTVLLPECLIQGEVTHTAFGTTARGLCTLVVCPKTLECPDAVNPNSSGRERICPDYTFISL
jgi:hypothetical protein